MRFTAGAQTSAIASFLHATTYPSAPSSAWSNLGFALFRSGMFVESAVAFRTTLRMDSSDINALYCLGRLSLLRPATAASGRWLLGRFLLREPRGARSRDAAMLLAASVGQH